MLDTSTPALRDAPIEKALLVIDDDDDHRATVRQSLEDEGYRVEVAINGKDALEKLSGAPPPDLILLDLFMPVMDGWAFSSAIRERPELSGIPIVVITGGGEKVLNAAPVSAGYLGKPLERSRLLQTISICLARRAQRESLTPGDSQA